MSHAHHPTRRQLDAMGGPGTSVPRLLCVADTCQPLIGEHVANCEDQRCRGCLPKPAADELLVCRQCRLRTTGRIEKLPDLYVDLLTPTRAPAGGGTQPGDQGDDAPATLAETTSPASDGALGARAQIRAVMVSWVKVLDEDFAKPVPADTIEALIAHVDWWSLTLLADAEHAGQFVAEIDELYREATRQAYPSAPLGQALGVCPTCATTVRSATTWGRIECRGCGAVRTVDQWIALLIGDLRDETSAIGPDLVAWLSARHNRPVSITALRHWATRGARIPKPEGGMQVVYLGRIGTDEYHRALYSVADAARIATGLFGAAKTGVSA